MISLNPNIFRIRLQCVALNLNVQLDFYTAPKTVLILSSLVSPLFFPARLRRRPLKGQRSRGSVSEGRVRAVHDPGIIREVMALVLRRRGEGRGPWRTRFPPFTLASRAISTAAAWAGYNVSGCTDLNSTYSPQKTLSLIFFFFFSHRLWSAPVDGHALCLCPKSSPSCT